MTLTLPHIEIVNKPWKIPFNSVLDITRLSIRPTSLKQADEGFECISGGYATVTVTCVVLLIVGVLYHYLPAPVSMMNLLVTPNKR